MDMFCMLCFFVVIKGRNSTGWPHTHTSPSCQGPKAEHAMYCADLPPCHTVLLFEFLVGFMVYVLLCTFQRCGIHCTVLSACVELSCT
jgi:hypothetical protein